MQSSFQGIPRMAGNHHVLERGKEGFFSRTFLEHGPTNDLILDLSFPDLWENELLF